jgi:chemotaxis protein methyltransferase CheR
LVNIEGQTRIAEQLCDEDVSAILSDIYQITGYNFINYTSAIVKRRLQRRLAFERISSLRELSHIIADMPEYAFRMVSDFSIHVTEMFRNPHFYKYFLENIIPFLREKEFIRIWAAGCSSGEEVYSLAIFLYEAGLYDRCRIYATDMNEGIIQTAKTGKIALNKFQRYESNYFSAGGKHELSSYFTFKEDAAYLHEDLLKNVLFSHHNLVSDRSFNEFHMIFCRNVLIYFNQWLRDDVHTLLFDSLSLNGYLALGDKETIRFTKHASSYNCLSPQQKIYQRKH